MYHLQGRRHRPAGRGSRAVVGPRTTITALVEPITELVAVSAQTGIEAAVAVVESHHQRHINIRRHHQRTCQYHRPIITISTNHCRLSQSHLHHHPLHHRQGEQQHPSRHLQQTKTSTATNYNYNTNRQRRRRQQLQQHMVV